MQEILDNWYFAVLPTLVYCGVGIAATRRLEATLDYLGGAIRSRADLTDFRRVVNLNMALALVVLLMAALYTLALGFSLMTGRLSPTTFFVYVCFLPLAGAACNQLYFRRVEARARDLRVVSADPEIEATYRRWLKEWGEPRLRLT